MQTQRGRRMWPVVLLGAVLSVVNTGSRSVAQPSQAYGVTDTDITGSIIGTQEDRVSVSAGDVVVLDQGRQRGVEVGDRYAVFEALTSAVHTRTGRRLHIEGDIIGELRVVSVTDQTAKAMVVHSIREVNTGALVAPLRVGGGPSSEARPTEREGQAVQARLAQVSPCLMTTSQTVQQAEQTGTVATEVAEARRVLEQAAMAVEQAQALVLAGDADRAAARLDTALADCTRASDLVRRFGAGAAPRPATTLPARS